MQLAHHGQPIVGDRKYGSAVKFPAGIALHARWLVIVHRWAAKASNFSAAAQVLAAGVSVEAASRRFGSAARRRIYYLPPASHRMDQVLKSAFPALPMPVSSDDRAPSGPVEAASRRLDVEAASRRFGNAVRVPIHIAMLKSVGSLWLTVALLVLLIGILLFGTVIEKYYGATAAKFGVYGAWWFNLLGLILGLNLSAALALRWPWKRQHLGFVLPHVGLIVLLIGCFVSRRYGVEATVSVLEGQESNRAYQGVRQHVELDGGQRFKLRIEPAAGTNAKDVPKETVIDVPFTSGPFNWQVYSELSLFPWGFLRTATGASSTIATASVWRCSIT